MLDPRITKLAKGLLQNSVRIQPGDKLLIEATDIDTPLITELVKYACQAGALPFVQIYSAAIERAILLGCTEQLCQSMAKYAALRMSEMDCYIGIRGGFNTYETSDVPSDRKQLYDRLYRHPVHSELRVKKTRWCILRYPNPSFAQLSGTSTEAFEDFYFDVCTLDYARMDKAMDALKALLERTDREHITGQGTDLSFSIRGIPAVKCSGSHNIPDGEVYTAPIRDSVNGVITYTAPSIHAGLKHEGVRLVFQNGRIVQATSNYTDALNAAFDTDEGARYVGEFALGVNPYIVEPLGDILFDEKISGSFHFTPGACYEEASNGNVSALHWDLVCIQTPEFGGGCIYFDDVLIRRDGRFVLPELEPLNPENLK